MSSSTLLKSYGPVCCILKSPSSIHLKAFVWLFSLPPDNCTTHVWPFKSAQFSSFPWSHFNHCVYNCNSLLFSSPNLLTAAILLSIYIYLCIYVHIHNSFCCCCSVGMSCPTLCNPMDCSPLGSSVHGISQARILEWVAMPFSRGFSWPRDQTRVSCLPGRFFTTEPLGKSCILVITVVTFFI